MQTRLVLQCAHNAALSNTRRQLLQHIIGLLTLLLPVLQVHGLLPQPSDFMIWVAVDGTVAAFGYDGYLQTLANMRGGIAPVCWVCYVGQLWRLLQPTATGQYL
jgi:hypothetical protein